jgi:hypothetical protein
LGPPDSKGICEKKNQLLLDAAYIRLTNAATWIVEGDCRDDDYLIRRETTWAVAAQWLARMGQETKTTRKVAALIARLEHAGVGYAKLYKLLWKQCVHGNLILQGIEYREGEAVSGLHEQIPTGFFLRPVFYGPASHECSDPRLMCELGPDLAPELAEARNLVAVADAIIDGGDARPAYRDVCISSKDTRTLKRLFRKRPGMRQRTAASIASAKLEYNALLRELNAKWPDERKRPSDRAMAKELATGTRKAETVRKVIAKARRSGELGSVTHKR